MSFITVPNTFVNGTLTDASKVNSNFTTLINGVSDGTKDIAVNKVTTSSDVAIGTSDAATARLDVNGTSLLLRLNSSSASVEPSMTFTKLSTVHGKIDTYLSSMYFYGGTASGGFHFLNSPNGTELVTITKTGRMGIGVTDPQQSLDVSGVIAASDFQVTKLNGSTTNVTGTELEILTSGSLSNADSLHTHLPKRNFGSVNMYAAQNMPTSGYINGWVEGYHEGNTTLVGEEGIQVLISGYYQVTLDVGLAKNDVNNYYPTVYLHKNTSEINYPGTSIPIRLNGSNVATASGTGFYDRSAQYISKTTVLNLNANDYINPYFTYAGTSGYVVSASIYVDLLQR